MHSWPGRELVFVRRMLVGGEGGGDSVWQMGSTYICDDGVHFQLEIRKISRLRPRFVDNVEIHVSPDNAEFSYFNLLFFRGRQRNVHRFITHVHSYCFAH